MNFFKNLWHSKLFKIILIIIIILVAIRIALPYVILHYANKTLANMPDYTGHIDHINLRIYRGATQIRDIKIFKREGNIPVPFYSCQNIDFAIDWKALFHGAIVARILVDHPKLNFVKGPSKVQTQTGPDTSWQKKMLHMMPLKINRFEIRDGLVHYRDFTSDPKVNVYVQQFNVIAENLTNSLSLSKSYFAHIKGQGIILKTGKFKFNVEYNPYAKAPTFALDAQLTGLSLPEMNDFIRAYGNFDVEKGTFNLYTKIAAKDGKFEGYAKPMFIDLHVFSFKEEHKNFIQGAWEALVGAVASVLQNKPHKQLATLVPVKGTIKDPQTSIWTAVGQLLRNAFIQALFPGIQERVTIKDVEKQK